MTAESAFDTPSYGHTGAALQHLLAQELRDPNCHLCDIDRHLCPGCGASLPHGVTACAACNAPWELMPQTSPLAEAQPAIVELDAVTAAWYQAIAGWDAETAVIAEKRARAVELIQAAMGDATEATIGGRTVVTWKPSKPSLRLDRKALEKEFGEQVIARYLRESKAARPFKVLDAGGGR